MLAVALVIVVVAAIWSVAAVAIALLTGGIIHERDHNDLPYGGIASPLSDASRPSPAVSRV